jgi:short-subunit dehydrogenase
MRQQRDCLIINIGSIFGRVTFPFLSIYGARKMAVEALTDSLRYEVSQLGVEVVEMQPSAYPTNSDWAQKHTHVSAEDFAANPHRNRLSILLSRTSHVAYHLGQTALAPRVTN